VAGEDRRRVNHLGLNPIPLRIIEVRATKFRAMKFWAVKFRAIKFWAIKFRLTAVSLIMAELTKDGFTTGSGLISGSLLECAGGARHLRLSFGVIPQRCQMPTDVVVSSFGIKP
jgi:hypothetical protein